MLRQLKTVGFAAVAGMLFLNSMSGYADTPLPTPPKALKSAVEGEWSCVADDMRRHHMDLLKHQRDDTMHEGIRTKRYSLKECIACHVGKDENGEKVSIHSREHFCNACHEYAAVTLDCFECHASQPEGGQ